MGCRPAGRPSLVGPTAGLVQGCGELETNTLQPQWGRDCQPAMGGWAGTARPVGVLGHRSAAGSKR